MKTEALPLSEAESMLHGWYEDYFSILYRYALPKLRFDESLAADCVHKVFDIAHNKANTLQHHANISAWLFKTLRYQIAKQYKKEKLHGEKQLAYALQNSSPFALESTIDDHLVSDDAISAAKEQILDSLTEKEREAHRLYYVERLTLKEICAQLNVSESALKARLFRLRNKVYDKITKEFDGNP